MFLYVYDILPLYVVDMFVVIGDFAIAIYGIVAIVSDFVDTMLKCYFKHIHSSYYAP
jgi:hypothetical protein